MIEFDTHNGKKDALAISIKILGIGGAGGNTVNSMIDSDLDNVGFVVANSDLQALRHSKASSKIQLGVKTTKGLGCGANPDLGRRATEEDLERVLESLGDADIVFLVAGMGGGTGSGGAPVIAKALKGRGVLTIAVVTKPFSFEGRRRMIVAQESLETLKKEVDTLIIVPNEKLLTLVDRSVSMIDAFEMINELLIHSVRSISSIISRSGHINVDFADLCAIMKGMGLAIMGTGSASGANRAQEAAQKAIASHLLENVDIKSARGVLLNISGGKSLSLHEINDAANVIYDASDKDAHIILGSVIDETLGDEVIVSVVATGFHAPVAIQPAAKEHAPKEMAKDAIVIPSREQAVILEPLLKKETHATLEKIEEVEKEHYYKSAAEKNVAQHEDMLDVPAFLRQQHNDAKSEEKI